MCGICGIVDFDEKIDSKLVQRMTDSLKHRGPDDEGYLIDGKPFSGKDSQVKLPKLKGKGNVILGHRRLSIIDLSAKGHQPMNKGKNWIVHNGEIYNYLELREELKKKGHRFTTKTDTEVVLAAYEEWGERCVEQFNGMFAFAIWNGKQLFCARDRFGIKPFYYHYSNERFFFGSEIKSILAAGVPRKPNDRIIYDYLMFSLQDHTRETFFKDIFQLRAGESMTLDTEGIAGQQYWDIEVNDSFSGDITQGEFTRRFVESVKLRLRSDVPIGTCLSGGMDSSSVVCVANKMIDTEKQKTFSAVFPGDRLDESKYMESVLKTTGAEKNFVQPTQTGLLKDLPKLIHHQDEPFGSTSIYAQWCVMRKAKERKVTVLLDGQGGDELLAGYLPYFGAYLKSLFWNGNWITFAKELMGLATQMKFKEPRHLMSLGSMLLPSSMRTETIVSKRAVIMDPKFVEKHDSRNKKYTSLKSAALPRLLENDLSEGNLPALLRYEDRNSMAFSREARVPFLDHEFAEYCASLPLDKKIAGGKMKALLKESMSGIVPNAILSRKDKIGFATPEDNWMKAELGAEMMRVFKSSDFKAGKYLNQERLVEEFAAFQAGKKSLLGSKDFWRAYNLEMWMSLI